jgi:hypothetical protein
VSLSRILGTGGLSLSRPLVAAAALPLDTLTASAAFSVRKLRTAYAGQCLRVRRNNDNAEQDVGFTAAGGLDTTALLAFVGANSGFVTAWYDQSGNGRNVAMSTAGFQPRIVNSGTLDTDGGLPNIVFIPTNFLAFGSYASWLQQDTTTINAVGKRTGGNANGCMVGYSTTTGPTGNQLRFSTSVHQIGRFNGSTFAAVTGSTNVGTARAIATATIDGARSALLYSNGTVQGSAVTLPVLSANSDLRVGILVTAQSVDLTGAISEVVVFPSVLSTADRNTVERNQGAFYGITIT